eukprot:24419_1
MATAPVDEEIEIAIASGEDKTKQELLVHIEMQNEPEREEKIEETQQTNTPSNDNEGELEHKYNDDTTAVALQAATTGKKDVKKFLKRHDTLTTELHKKFTASDDLRLPYKTKNCWSMSSYYMKSLVVTNPRLFSGYLLYSSIWPRVLVLVDMYTDFIVAKDLYEATSNEKQIENLESLDTKESAMLFMLTCVFIIFPFVMVWTASLRFVHRFLVRDYNRKKHDKCTTVAFNTFLMLYLFPPVGCVLMSLLEIYWVFYDIIRGIYHFCIGKILIINTDPQIKAIKEFRKVIEFFGESFPQLFLQLYIKYSLGSDYVDANSLTLSICISAFNFAYNLYKLYRESRMHGMTIAEYALSLLQLSEIPIIKLVPRLPAIRNGLTDLCNFAYFDIDKESLGPIIDALSDTRCRLTKMKLSIDSLSYLDDESLTMLGGFLHRKDLKIIISQTAHPEMILKLFQNLDAKNKGYLKFEQFQKLLSFAFHDEQIQKRIFENLAVRRVQQRDRIYFYDFYESIAGYKSQLTEYDFGIIEYPIHWIVQYCTKLFQHCTGDDSTDLLIDFDVDRYQLDSLPEKPNNWKIVLNKLSNLYYFAAGCNYDIQFDETNGHIHHNIFFTIADALSAIEKIKTDQVQDLGEFVSKFDLTRRLIEAFIWKICWLLLTKTNAAQTIDELNSKEEHVFEHCVRRGQWRLFTILLHYSLLHGSSHESLSDFMNLDQIRRQFPRILEYALHDNLEEPVRYLLNQYSLDKVLYNQKEYKDKTKDDLYRSRVWRLFHGIFESRLPSVSMMKLLLELLDAEKTNLLSEIMLNSANLLVLAIRFRVKVRDKDRRTVGSTLDAITSYCVRQILEVEDESLIVAYRQEETKYKNAMLEIIALLVSTNNDLCNDLNLITNDSPISYAVDHQDHRALKTILQNIEDENMDKILLYKYEQYENQNILSLVMNNINGLYDIANYLIQNYLFRFNPKEFNGDSLTDNPYMTVFKEYLYSLTNNNAKNGAFYTQNITALYSIVNYIAEDGLARDVMEHISKSMNKKTNQDTYQIIEQLNFYISKKGGKPYTISDLQMAGLWAHWKQYKPFEAKDTLDDDLQATRRQQRHKILILGVGATGKATLFKQLINIHGGGFTDEDFTAKAKHIQDAIVVQMKNILYQFRDPETDEFTAKLPSELSVITTKVANASPEMPLSHVVHHIRELWAHDTIKAEWENRDNVAVAESTKFFFDDLDRLSAANYRPTVDDILLARIPTTGINERVFTINENEFDVFQGGSQRSERNKWIHCFGGVDAILYVASLGDFDQYMYEENELLTMHEQLELFDLLLRSRYFRHASFILYLNKSDVFTEKIKKGKSLKVCFPEYDGEDGDVEYALEYIRKQFLSLNTDENRQIYTHVTCNIDRDNVIKTFDDVQHLVVMRRLQMSLSPL